MQGGRGDIYSIYSRVAYYQYTLLLSDHASRRNRNGRSINYYPVFTDKILIAGGVGEFNCCLHY